VTEKIPQINWNSIDPDRLEQLRAAAGDGPVLILSHDNPDPDSLSSGKGLAVLLQSAWGVPSRLMYSGLVARAENRAMLQLLTPDWEHIDLLPDLKNFSAVALVDTQPGAGNNSLPEEHIPQIVIDHHHPLRDELDRVPFIDVRPKIGSTASMVYEYLDAAGIELDETLSTALFYGVQTDTRGLARGGSTTDEYVYLNLLPHLDRLTLIRVEQAGLSRDYYRAFCNGLEAARVYEHSTIASLGDLQRPDLTAEMADILIRMEGVRAVLCLGFYQDTLFFSLRTEPLGQDAGLLVQRIIKSFGKAGGHGTMAGGQVSLEGKDPDKMVQRIEGRFLKVMNEDGEGERLLSD